MRRFLLLAISLLTISIASNAQSAKSFYFEFGGPGIVSVNFDTRFGNNEAGLGARVGFGGFSISVDDKNYGIYFVPLGANYLLGKDNRNYFEIGAGITPVIYDGPDKGQTFTSSFGHLLFGYRLQPLNGGFTFRGFFSPIYGNFGFFPLAGISFGYKF